MKFAFLSRAVFSRDESGYAEDFPLAADGLLTEKAPKEGLSHCPSDPTCLGQWDRRM